MKSTGEAIRRLRERENLSQRALAQALQVSELTVARWENGTSKPGFFARNGLMKLFKVRAEELGFEGVSDGYPQDPIYPDLEGGRSAVQIEPISLFPKGPFYKDPNLCFVLMPFTKDFALQEVYEDGIKPGIVAAGLHCRRADDILNPGTIIKQVWQSIMEARFIVADLTSTNGNVLYELGLAHVIGHEAILLTQEITHVPYDLRQQRHIIYSITKRGIEGLRDTLRATLERLK